MSAHFPDGETIRSALMLAVRAPSVHNSQPWQWRVGEQSVHLYANPDLRLPHTDPDARDLMLSCGAALNHCQVAFAALGWQSKVHRFPNPADPNHLAAMELHRYPATEVDVALAAAIPRRRTDRRHYSSWPVPQREIAMMGARAARAGVMLRRVDALANLKRLVTEAAWRHGADPRLFDRTVHLEWTLCVHGRCPGAQHSRVRSECCFARAVFRRRGPGSDARRGGGR